MMICYVTARRVMRQLAVQLEEAWPTGKGRQKFVVSRDLNLPQYLLTLSLEQIMKQTI